MQPSDQRTARVPRSRRRSYAIRGMQFWLHANEQGSAPPLQARSTSVFEHPSSASSTARRLVYCQTPAKPAACHLPAACPHAPWKRRCYPKPELRDLSAHPRPGYSCARLTSDISNAVHEAQSVSAGDVSDMGSMTLGTNQQCPPRRRARPRVQDSGAFRSSGKNRNRRCSRSRMAQAGCHACAADRCSHPALCAVCHIMREPLHRHDQQVPCIHDEPQARIHSTLRVRG